MRIDQPIEDETKPGGGTAIPLWAAASCRRWLDQRYLATAFAALGIVLTALSQLTEAGALPPLVSAANGILCVGAIWLIIALISVTRSNERQLGEANAKSTGLAAFVASEGSRHSSERRKAEIALINSEGRFRLAVEATRNGIVMTDEKGSILLANPQTEKMFGYAPGELLGQCVDLLVPERFRGEHKGERAGFLADPSARAMAAGRDLFGQRKDGSEFPVEISLNSIRTVDGLVVLSGVTDLTERKRIDEKLRRFNDILERQVAERTEQLTAANRELEEFAFVASHDLKAPLRVIDNASKWLEEDLQEHLTDDTRESMALLRGRVKRMEKLLDDLLEYSSIGRKMDPAHGEMVAGNVLMENVLALLTLPSGFTVNISPTFAHVQLLRMPLQQILLNLIGNAIKHHDKKCGTVEVTLDDDGGAHYAFAVKDDGPGIPKQFQGDVFKMFNMLKPRDHVEGSGMGLAMVRKHIEVAGGSLSLESGEGRGCVFRFAWPKKPPSLRAAA